MKKLPIIFLLFAVFSQFYSGAEAQILPEKFDDGFILTRPVESYDQGNLFELIDGQAVFYLSYGFVKLEHGFYKKTDMEYKVDVYEVADNLSALGCYREQKDDESSPLSAGTEGYLAEYLSAFYKDKYYVEITPVDSGDLNVEEVKKLSSDVEKKIPGKAEIPPEISYFAQNNLITGSETYFGESLLSYSFLGKGMSALYNQNNSDSELRVFISMAESKEKAKSIYDEFVKTLKETNKTTLGKLEGTKGELAYRGASEVFAYGNFVFGCIGMKDEMAANATLNKILENISATDSK